MDGGFDIHAGGSNEKDSTSDPFGAVEDPFAAFDSDPFGDNAAKAGDKPDDDFADFGDFQVRQHPLFTLHTTPMFSRKLVPTFSTGCIS